jgi:protein-disulfide isomerase
MSIDEIQSKQPDMSSGKISIKKSTLIGLLISLIMISLVAVFFAGSYVSLKSEEITKSELHDAISKLESNILKNQQITDRPNIQPIQISIDDDPVMGNPAAPITIVEFSDFQCPFCARFHTQTFPLIMKQYVETDKVKFVYRDFPIQNSHPNAMPAAVASECAHEQNKYWEYHNMLFENQGTWNKLEIPSSIMLFKEFASTLDLNEEQFNSCLDSGQYLDEINNDLKDGRSYDITGTPAFFIGNEEIGFVKLNGAQPFDAFKSVIDSQINT